MIKRWLYRKYMFKAIDAARNSLFENRASKTDGLRTIKEFEKVNSIQFDPFNSFHVQTISGLANFTAFFRAAKRLHFVNHVYKNKEL